MQTLYLNAAGAAPPQIRYKKAIGSNRLIAMISPLWDTTTVLYILAQFLCCAPAHKHNSTALSTPEGCEPSEVDPPVVFHRSVGRLAVGDVWTGRGVR